MLLITSITKNLITAQNNILDITLRLYDEYKETKITFLNLIYLTIQDIYKEFSL